MKINSDNINKKYIFKTLNSLGFLIINKHDELVSRPVNAFISIHTP